MKHIQKLSLQKGKLEEITLFKSAFTDKLDIMNIDPKDAIVKICAECAKNDVQLFVIAQTVACQAPLCVKFSRQE